MKSKKYKKYNRKKFLFKLFLNEKLYNLWMNNIKNIFLITHYTY